MSAIPALRRQTAPDRPLHAQDVQRAVLGAALMDSSLLRGPLAGISVRDFVGSADQAIYAAMLQLAENGENFDHLVLAQALEGRGEVANGGAYLGKLIDGALSDPDIVKRHAATLQRLSQLRTLRLLGETLERETCELGADPSVLLERAQKRIESLRAGYDLDNNLLPYAPRDLAHHPEILTLSNVQACEVEWLWRPYLANGMLAMLSGDPGAGKTYIALAIAAALTIGRVPYTGDPCSEVDVLYLSVENSAEHVLRPRFDSLGGNAAHFHILRGSVMGDGKRANRRAVKLSDIQLLDESLRKTNARLLVVDPIQSYLGAEVDAHRSNETRPVLDGLARLGEEHHACILLVRHFAKPSSSGGGRAIHRGLGSIDLTGAVRTELHAGSLDDQRAMVQAKSNLGQFGKSLGYVIEEDGSFRWTGESSLTAGDLQAPESTSEERSALEEAKDFLIEMTAEGPRPSKELKAEAEARGLAWRTIDRAKAAAGVKSVKRHFSGEWVFELRSTPKTP